jgi:hypothetical protein
MAAVSERIKPDFIVSLGDNFYYHGIKTDSHDKRFHQTFENVYSNSSMSHIPWYIVAGNHDHEGNITAQVEYSALSSRWNFPEFVYNQTFIINNKNLSSYTVQMIMIDTTHLVGNYDENEPQDKILANNEYLKLVSILENSIDADYIWVIGHYPIYSLCSHGSNMNNLKLKINHLLHKYEAHYMV